MSEQEKHLDGGERQFAATGPDTVALQQAQRTLDKKAKDATKQLRELQEAADEVRQASLFSEPEFEPELLMTVEERKKKYTGAQAEKMEWRRDATLLMLARAVPVEDIARVMRMNLRTITALAQRHGQQLATFSEEYAKQLNAIAGGWIALANTKAHEASTLQLATAAGILMDKALQVKGGLAPGDGEGAIELEAVDPKLEAAREFLKRRDAKNAEKI